jgi:hypothetical protein
MLLTLLIPINSFATIHSVSTMEEVSHYLQNADSQSLAIFDVDLVLIQPADPAFQMANFKKYASIAKEIFHSLTFDQKIAFLNLAITGSSPVVIDTMCHQIFDDLDSRQIKRIALTASLTGEFDSITNMVDWRIDQLNQVNINFAKFSSCNFKFEEYAPYRGNLPEFKEGILFTNGIGELKGDLLVDFLNRANFCPKLIVCVDDREKNLINIEEALHRCYPSLEFIGLHYTGAADYCSPFIDEATFLSKWQELAERAKRA